MSMLDSLRSKLGIDPDADSYVDDTEENVFPGGQGAAAAQEYTQQQEIKQHSNKVVNINATTQLQVVLVKPERFDDASSIADQLNAKHTVVLNLESASKEVSRRLIDFLSGVAYANNGQIKRVATSTFIITPYNVDIMGDLLDELENNGCLCRACVRISSVLFMGGGFGNGSYGSREVPSVVIVLRTCIGSDGRKRENDRVSSDAWMSYDCFFICYDAV